MLREWTGTVSSTRDHSNFSNRMTFPLVTPIHSFPEIGIGNNTDEKVQHGAQAPEAVTVAGQETALLVIVQFISEKSPRDAIVVLRTSDFRNQFNQGDHWRNQSGRQDQDPIQKSTTCPIHRFLLGH